MKKLTMRFGTYHHGSHRTRSINNFVKYIPSEIDLYKIYFKYIRKR